MKYVSELCRRKVSQILFGPRTCKSLVKRTGLGSLQDTGGNSEGMGVQQEQLICFLGHIFFTFS